MNIESIESWMLEMSFKHGQNTLGILLLHQDNDLFIYYMYFILANQSHRLLAYLVTPAASAIGIITIIGISSIGSSFKRCCVDILLIKVIIKAGGHR